MKNIGSLLKEAREKRKLSIQDVAIATKINNKIIASIEDGDAENLPAKPFLRGFVQSYARYLELNVDEIMKKFLEIQGSTKPKPQITETGSSSQVSHEEVQNKFELYKKIAYVAATLIAVIFIYFIQKTVSKYEQESKVAKEQQEAVKSQIVPAEEAKSPEVEGPSAFGDTAPVVVVTETKPEIKLEEKKVEDKKSEDKKPEPKPTVVSSVPLVTAPIVPITPPVVAPTPKPVEVKPVETKPIVKEEVKPEIKPEIKVEEKKTTLKSQQIIIEALDNVEIRYSKDGEGERTVKLKPEQFLTIKAVSKINLSVSDSGAVNIIHNGRDKGVPGNLGQPTKISYP